MSRFIYLGRETERKTGLDPVLITYLEAEFKATINATRRKSESKFREESWRQEVNENNFNTVSFHC